jgi:hypothetical protein
MVDLFTEQHDCPSRKLRFEGDSLHRGRMPRAKGLDVSFQIRCGGSKHDFAERDSARFQREGLSQEQALGFGSAHRNSLARKLQAALRSYR